MTFRLALTHRAKKHKPSVMSIAAAAPRREPVDRVELVLPVPPSVNRLWTPNGHGGLRRTDVYNAWIEDAGWALVRQKPGRVAEGYNLLIEVPAASRADVSNLEKAASDLLERHGVVTNDKFAKDVRVIRSAGDEFRVTVTRAATP